MTDNKTEGVEVTVPLKRDHMSAISIFLVGTKTIASTRDAEAVRPLAKLVGRITDEPFAKRRRRYIRPILHHWLQEKTSITSKLCFQHPVVPGSIPSAAACPDRGIRSIPSSCSCSSSCIRCSISSPSPSSSSPSFLSLSFAVSIATSQRW